MEDGLDVVAVGVEDERAVIALVIDRALARRAVVTVPGLDRRPVERLDLLAALRDERDVDVLAQRLAVLCNREVAPLRQPLVRVLPAELVAERQEHRRVERLRGLEVGHPKRDVIDHSGWCVTASMLLPSGSST